jgi:hypothetical protein
MSEDGERRENEARLFALEAAVTILLSLQGHDSKKLIASEFDKILGKMPPPKDLTTHDLVVRSRAAFHHLLEPTR